MMMSGFVTKRVLPVLLVPLILSVGCEKAPTTEAVSVQEDVVLNDGSIAKEWVVEEIVPVPAPPKAITIIGERPSNEHIWVPGGWQRSSDRWLWEKGRWAKPPHPRASWSMGHWRRQDSKWHWRPGEWVVSDRPEFVTEAIPVPEPLSEVVPDQPFDKDYWIAGSWDWDGRWLWIPGYWETMPDPDAVWVPGHWDDRGLDGGFRWVRGSWMVTN
jgi:hypothetical protein